MAAGRASHSAPGKRLAPTLAGPENDDNVVSYCVSVALRQLCGSPASCQVAGRALMIYEVAHRVKQMLAETFRESFWPTLDRY